MTNLFSCYLCLEQLPDDVKKANKIKIGARVPRFDVTATAGYYEPLEAFKNAKGMLFFYLQKTTGIINSPDNRRAVHFLQCSKDSCNFSSIFTVDITRTGKIVAFGEPNGSVQLRRGKSNPFYKFRNDGYLFLISKDYSRIEILVIPNGRHTIRGNVQQLINGNFDDALQTIRKNAQLMYNYWDLPI